MTFFLLRWSRFWDLFLQSFWNHATETLKDLLSIILMTLSVTTVRHQHPFNLGLKKEAVSMFLF